MNTQEDNTENFGELAKGIAAALGEGWSGKAVPSEWPGKAYSALEFTHEDGRSFDLRRGYNDKGKFHVSGNYPRYVDGRFCTPRDAGAVKYNESNPSINVSAAREPQVIARDIVRRFLPEFTRCWLACVERVAQDLEHINGTSKSAERIRKALGKGADPQVSKDQDKRNSCVSLNYHAYSFYGDFRVSDGTGELSLKSVPVAVLVEIATLLAKHAK